MLVEATHSCAPCQEMLLSSCGLIILQCILGTPKLSQPAEIEVYTGAGAGAICRHMLRRSAATSPRTGAVQEQRERHTERSPLSLWKSEIWSPTQRCATSVAKTGNRRNQVTVRPCACVVLDTSARVRVKATAGKWTRCGPLQYH